MTVSYAGFRYNFAKLLLRWHGGIWKSLLFDLLVYLTFYSAVSCVYRFALDADQRRTFEKIALTCREYTKSIPLTFLLGFYVSIVVKRWWEQFNYIPWPDNVMFWVSAYIRGNDERSRCVRRQIARYLILTAVLALRGVSVRVYKRFPTLDHVETAGLMTKAERDIYDSIELKFQPHHQWFLPLNWILSIFVSRSQTDGNLKSGHEMRQLVKGIEYYRQGYEKIFVYDWIAVPLVYTQVATIATYGFFALCLLGSQYLSPEKPLHHEIDMYFPFINVLQFVFYVGWLKVGEDLMNPFGDDDEDFELNYLLDRHTEMAFLIADIHGQLPPTEPSVFDTTGFRFQGFPHTVASKGRVDVPPKCHLRDIELSKNEQYYANEKDFLISIEKSHIRTNSDESVNCFCRFQPELRPSFP